MTTEQTGFRPPEQVRALPLAGAMLPLDDMRYQQLYEHSQQLGYLAEWDGHGIFAGAGVLVFGAGLGAWAAGKSIEKPAVFGLLILGVVLLFASSFIKRATIVSAHRLKISFDQSLSMYEVQNEEIKKMKDHFDSLLPAKPTSPLKRCRRFFNF